MGVSLCTTILGLSACESNRTAKTTTTETTAATTTATGTTAKGTTATQVERDALVTVEAVDVPNRLVTVRNASGDSFIVYVDEANKAFPQAAVGDQVRVRYVESLALRMASAGAGQTGLKVTESTIRPQAGLPAGRTSAEVTATVRIEEVKSNGSVVTFTGPRGRRTLTVRDPGMKDFVSKLKPGDHVEATYSEALALSLEKAAR